MAAGVVKNFFLQDSAPPYFSMSFPHSSCPYDEEVLGSNSKEREDEEDREDEEEEDDCEAQEEEEGEEMLDGFAVDPAVSTLDMTKQLLRFADLISRDVQRYFGRRSDERQTFDIYGESGASAAPSGRLRYYDDLLKIAKEGTQKMQECSGSSSSSENQGPSCSSSSSSSGNSLGPLAELFDQKGLSHGRGQPMIKRHLPLSFWTEPVPQCTLMDFSDAADIIPCSSSSITNTDYSKHTSYSLLMHSSAHPLCSAQPDFSDLLANWDPNLEFGHMLTEDIHMQH